MVEEKTVKEKFKEEKHDSPSSFHRHKEQRGCLSCKKWLFRHDSNSELYKIFPRWLQGYFFFLRRNLLQVESKSQ